MPEEIVVNGKLMIGIAAGLTVGVGAGWLAGGTATSDRDRIAEQLAVVELERDAVADENAAATTELEAVTRRVGRLDRELGAARAALAAAETELENTRAAVAEPDVAADIVAEDGADSGLGQGQTFSFPEYDEHLAAVNWNDVGKHVSAMAPLLSEIFEAVSKGEQPSPEAIGGIQQHNGPLVTAAMTLHNKLPGETVNGAFTHPSAVVNMIASTLAAMGKPLSAEQLASLERVGCEFVAEDRRRVQSYSDDTLALRRHAEESLLKGRFYAAAMATLTDEQHTMLRPETTRGRITVDLFSASLVWVGRAKPIPFRDRAHLADILGERVGRELDLDAAGRERLSTLVSDWASDLPEEMVMREPDALWLKGLVPINAIDLAAQHQIELIDRMLAELDLSEEAAGGLREHKGVFVPTWRPGT